MALFDNLRLPSSLGNVLGAASQKIQEGANKVVSTLGGTGPFTKVAAIRETLTEGAIKQQFLRSEIASKNADAEAQFLAYADAALQDPFSTNAMTSEELQQSLMDQADSEVSTAAIRADASALQDETNHFVSLTQINQQNEKFPQVVVFTNMPEVTESRTIEYEAVAPSQAPAAFQKYKGTSSVQWSVNATLTCRTTEEATNNLRILNLLRGWSMPYYGENTRREYPKLLGAPPPVLRFEGWRKQMVGPVPVVITSLNWTFPQDVDYIPAEELDSSGGPAKLIPFPTVMKVALQLVESFSTGEINGFNLGQFKVGNFDKAWSPLPGKNVDSAEVLQGSQAPVPEEAQQTARSAGIGATDAARQIATPGANTTSTNTTDLARRVRSTISELRDLRPRGGA